MASAPYLDAEAVRVELQSYLSRLDRALASVTRAHEAELAVFFSGLAAAVDVARVAQAELDRREATRFSIFHYFYERETDLSRVFKDLLDPAGSHGQGSRFLGLFLQEVCRGVYSGQRASFPTSNFEGCRVYLEFVTDEGRRIDIVLELPGNRWVGIENKPWAGEQESRRARWQITCSTSVEGRLPPRPGMRGWCISVAMAGTRKPCPMTIKKESAA